MIGTGFSNFPPAPTIQNHEVAQSLTESPIKVNSFNFRATSPAIDLVSHSLKHIILPE
ncbi:hypothetical protein ACFO1V_06940 [Daeguia caeni]|uniref:Uncharacterized protein n=1 Tax=Daeguia caeni TaxID=439612 RepID=A0ABV9H639_9HYPH